MAPAPFVLPAGSEADAPPEHRGLSREGVRLLVAREGEVDAHHRFFELPDLLASGDLLVINTSATVPAAVDAELSNGEWRTLHVSSERDDGAWIIEVRRPDNRGPDPDCVAGESLRLAGGHALRLVEATGRFWIALVSPAVRVTSYLGRHGRPISYSYLADDYPLADFQNVYAEEAGSAEMASAGRPFSAELIARLAARGITIAPIVLHTGVSSPERHEPPQAERFTVSPDTARLVESARSAGRRVVAVGTTVVRALETAADSGGVVRPATGWTELVLGPNRPARVVTGLISGLHLPEASHLSLLEAVAGRDLVDAAYAEAVAERYLWHEFGDAMLFLPDLARRRLSMLR
jgi:S-adenosylmethionine:tRNA ribosyltransferase-isomerase